MNLRYRFRVGPVALAGLLVAAVAAMSGAVASPAVMDQLNDLQKTAVASYNQRDWAPAAQAADAYEAALDEHGLPRAGADYAVVAFIGGHARFELWKADASTFSYDFEEDVVGAMKESLRILQDDPFFKHNILGTAYFEKLRQEHYESLELENAANWHMMKALLARHDELRDAPRDSEEYTAFAKYLLMYANRAFEMARHSPNPELYLIRVREACRMGFGSEFDDRFAQLYQVVGFDDGNAKAGILWQTALDLMNTEGSDPGEVLATFASAAAETEGETYRAEVFRQMADYASRQDGHDYKLKAVEYGRMAFKLDPTNEEIQVQYGTSLHVVSYAHYVSGRYDDALEAAQEATSFEWAGDEVAYFDLSRSQANFGDKINALTHAEHAYEKALKKYSGEELQPYRQNYVNILRQFGLVEKAEQVELTAKNEGS
jgi:hypothetical protein